MRNKQLKLQEKRLLKLTSFSIRIETGTKRQRNWKMDQLFRN